MPPGVGQRRGARERGCSADVNIDAFATPGRPAAGDLGAAGTRRHPSAGKGWDGELLQSFDAVDHVRPGQVSRAPLNSSLHFQGDGVVRPTSSTEEHPCQKDGSGPSPPARGATLCSNTSRGRSGIAVSSMGLLYSSRSLARRCSSFAFRTSFVIDACRSISLATYTFCSDI